MIVSELFVTPACTWAMLILLALLPAPLLEPVWLVLLFVPGIVVDLVAILPAPVLVPVLCTLTCECV